MTGSASPTGNSASSPETSKPKWPTSLWHVSPPVAPQLPAIYPSPLSLCSWSFFVFPPATGKPLTHGISREQGVQWSKSREHGALSAVAQAYNKEMSAR
eukprot:CAMPEP_0182910768 /NCGR_PEP_ID=MMETSP0034_2-20130328/36516_1 /TAXON_ID=156128 /ORGANISM="Nephroselmis pyriformis, Strain CCMP717" /LENGTH=98 /DNA_ID=CAMNT_0025047177 /DNA_START=1 /DNA_END=293 /DNA_ORIENTATION=-